LIDFVDSRDSHTLSNNSNDTTKENITYHTMTLLRDAVKYGALFGVAREVGKAYNNKKSSVQPPQRYPPQGQYYQQPVRDQASYGHQSFYSGHCGGQCGDIWG
jgi:hypothetical protein